MKYKNLKVLIGAFTLSSLVLAGCNPNENEKINNQQTVSENTIDTSLEKINTVKNKDLARIEEEIYDLECRVEELDDEIEDLEYERSEILQQINAIKEEKKLIEGTHPLVIKNESLKYYDEVTEDINLNDNFIKSEEEFVYVLEKIILNRKKANSDDTKIEISNIEIKKYSDKTKQKFNEFLVELGEISELRASGLALENIDFLENIEVHDLDLSYNKIENIETLTTIRGLKYLNLSNNKINSISPLSNITELQSIDLSYNHVNDLKPLSNLLNIFDLNLRWNGISNLTPLSNLLNIKYLTIDHNYITSFDGLEKLYNLKILDAKRNHVKNVTGILPIVEKNDVWITFTDLSEENIIEFARVINDEDNVFIGGKVLKINYNEN